MIELQTPERERLLRIAQAARREILAKLLRVGRPVSAVLMWLSVWEDKVVGIDVFGHPILLEELAKRDSAIGRLLASPLPRKKVRIVVDDRARRCRVAGYVVLGAKKSRPRGVE